MALQIPNWGYFTPKTGSGGPPYRTPRHISCMTATSAAGTFVGINDKLRGSTKNLGFPLNYLKSQVLKIEPTKSKGLGSTGISRFPFKLCKRTIFWRFLLGILGTITCHQLPPLKIYMFANKRTSINSIRSNGFTRPGLKKTCQLCNCGIFFPCLGFTRDS